jgi:hypothetical protein
MHRLKDSLPTNVSAADETFKAEKTCGQLIAETKARLDLMAGEAEHKFKFAQSKAIRLIEKAANDLRILSHGLAD